ncbi:MAG: RNA polymerase sigma factor region1.1 domain-containing protein, partial [Gaiellaceae bacterium]
MKEGRGNGAGGLTLDDDATKALVKQGQDAGFLTQEEIALALDELDWDTVQVDEFYQGLEELHIEVVETQPEEEEAVVVRAEVSEVSTDSLQLFLKDIGKVPLLTAAQEVEL